MRASSRTGAALAAALALVVAGGGYAFGASQGGTITVCVHHHGGGLYRASKCAKHDKKLSWSSQGVPGAQGPAGSKGADGTPGTPAAPGPAGPLTTIAPSGSTQKGEIAVTAYADQAAEYAGSQALTFPLQLSAAPTVVQVPYQTTNVNCPGTVAAPTAQPGYLCIYVRNDSNVHQANAGDDFYPTNAAQGYGADTYGVVLKADSAAVGLIQIFGSWAVTAP
jgi:hypothetical protein